MWDGGFLGRVEGREAIRRFFQGSSGRVRFAVHGISNPLIEIDGDRATGRWYLHQPMALRGDAGSHWLIAQYHDDYVRTAEGWKFAHVRVVTRAFTPYGQGFTEPLIADLPPRS